MKNGAEEFKLGCICRNQHVLEVDYNKSRQKSLKTNQI